ncbi:MAG TPA: VTT domain-containing protein [Polyangiaceae bacterium]
MAESDSELPELGSRELVTLVARLLLGFAILLGIVGMVGYLVRRPTEQLARYFVDSYGVWGLAFGTLLADGLHFPIPPQFYLLTVVASGAPPWRGLLAIISASVLAGGVGYYLSQLASHATWLSAKVRGPRRLFESAFRRYGYRAALVGSLLPIPYSVLCYLAGLNGLPRRFLAILALCRVPKLVAFYYLIRLGWA